MGSWEVAVLVKVEPREAGRSLGAAASVVRLLLLEGPVC